MQVKEWLHLCAFSPVMCHLVFLQLMCLCASAITLVKLIRLLAILLHHVNLQCVGESGGGVIVLFAAVWIFSDMPPRSPNRLPS